MAGHSKWANIKHRKERSDQKKGKIFSRIMKEVISAVRQGGADPKTNHKLRLAIQKAREANVPNENIERNIKKAASEDQQEYFELTYELYGFGGVGILAEVMTDNKNRISSDMRIATNKCGGTVASPGAVSYNFERKGVFRIEESSFSQEDLFLLASELGADDFTVEDGNVVITSSFEKFPLLKESLRKAGVSVEQASLEMVPKTQVEVSGEDESKNVLLIEWLENLDDVDAVYHNMKFSYSEAS